MHFKHRQHSSKQSGSSRSHRRCHLALGLAVLVLLPAASSAQDAGETLLFVGGRWFDGQSFRKARFYSVDGILRSEIAGRVDRKIDLKGTFVVPAFGEAHNHNVADADGLDATIRRYLREGVFYVKTMSNLPRLTEPIRSRLNRPDSLDVVFANGGLTATGGHPVRLREQLLERGAYPGFTKESLKDHGYYIIDHPADLERKWESILGHRPDFIKAFLLRSEEFEKRRDDPDYFGRKGLDPEILPLIVERAHAADLRVSVHIETGTDFHHAVAAGADEIPHLPGYARAPQTIRPEDAALAAERGVVVTTTASLARQQSRDTETTKQFARRNERIFACCTNTVLRSPSVATTSSPPRFQRRPISTSSESSIAPYFFGC